MLFKGAHLSCQIFSRHHLQFVHAGRQHQSAFIKDVALQHRLVVRGVQFDGKRIPQRARHFALGVRRAPCKVKLRLVV